MSRTQEIAKIILDLLADWEEPADEAVLHAQVESRTHPTALFSEFNDALHLCQMQRWVTGVRNPLKGVRYSITDKGRAERHA